MAKRKTTRSKASKGKGKGKTRRTASRDPIAVAQKRSKNTGGVVVLL